MRHPHALTLFEDTVYWSDRRENRISKCNKFSCTNQTVVRNRVYSPLGITAVHPARQPQGRLNYVITPSCQLSLLQNRFACYILGCTHYPVENRSDKIKNGQWAFILFSPPTCHEAVLKSCIFQVKNTKKIYENSEILLLFFYFPCREHACKFYLLFFLKDKPEHPLSG